ncbi:MAG: hypothetical protein AB7P00_20315 [Sandaracinaceae bacterium]
MKFTNPLSTKDLAEFKPVLVMVVRAAYFLAILLIVIGLFAIGAGVSSVGPTQVTLWDEASLSTTSVGITLAFLGVVLFGVTALAVVRAGKDIAGV